jgi:hypothetical protein
MQWARSILKRNMQKSLLEILRKRWNKKKKKNHQVLRNLLCVLMLEVAKETKRQRIFAIIEQRKRIMQNRQNRKI